ncbi:hypothetical protein [Pseudonocardia sp. H11422]|uniref:hypothetical protein n=1 Tax=Pseudonocardia sp. H11422 TaxID=2835866 RepID=UPI001BDC7155|nr:hypothetical protein [Pseudonocardia sp. H11422]
MSRHPLARTTGVDEIEEQGSALLSSHRILPDRAGPLAARTNGLPSSTVSPYFMDYGVPLRVDAPPPVGFGEAPAVRSVARSLAPGGGPGIELSIDPSWPHPRRGPASSSGSRSWPS